MKWGTASYDTFEGEWYGGNYFPFDTEEEAKKKAQEEANQREQTQPSSSSGGAGYGGIQDRIYVVNDAGYRYQVLPDRKA